MTAVDLPIPVVVTRHQCQHCRKTWAKQDAAQAHIGRCWKNPAVRNCKTCDHLEPPENGPYPEHPGWPEGCGIRHEIGDRLNSHCPSWTPAN